MRAGLAQKQVSRPVPIVYQCHKDMVATKHKFIVPFLLIVLFLSACSQKADIYFNPYVNEDN